MHASFQLESNIETLDQKDFILYLMDLNLLKKNFTALLAVPVPDSYNTQEIMITLLGDVCIIVVENTKNILIYDKIHFLKILVHRCALFLKF
ncbi:hypothetical protein H311_03648 [Anncaliia algerae PRA109]|nr:hypothetical protein H311_03648 [Anncaliia algerae PRA109]